MSREGWPLLAVTAIVAVIVTLVMGYRVSLPFWLLLPGLAYIFRNPARPVPAVPLAVVSPVDGRVITIEKIHDPFLDRLAQRVQLRISALGSYGIRSPTEGKLIKQWFFPQDSHLAAEEKHRPVTIYRARHFAMWLQTDELDDITMVLKLPRRWQRLHCHVSVGERVGQGQRCGMLFWGGEVDIYLPETFRLEVGAGDTCHAGTTIMGSYLH